jgi:flagellar hook-length control protein FliK
MSPAAAKRGATRPGVTVASGSSAGDNAEPAADRPETLRPGPESLASGATSSPEAVPGETTPPEDFSSIPAFLLLSAGLRPTPETTSSRVSDDNMPAIASSDPAPESLSGVTADGRTQALPMLESLPLDPSTPPDGGQSAKNAPLDAFPLALTIALAASHPPCKPEFQVMSTQALSDSGKSGSEPAESQTLSMPPGFDSAQAAVQAMAQGMIPAFPFTLNPSSPGKENLQGLEKNAGFSPVESSRAGNLPGTNTSGLKPSEMSGLPQNTAPGSAESATGLSAPNVSASPEAFAAVSASDGNVSFSDALDSAANRMVAAPETGSLSNPGAMSDVAASTDFTGLTPVGGENGSIPSEAFSSTTSDRIPDRSSSAEGLKAFVPTMDAGIAPPGGQAEAKTSELRASGRERPPENAGTGLNAGAFMRLGLDDARSAAGSTEMSGWETALRNADGSEKSFSLAEGAIHTVPSLQDAVPGGSTAALNPAIAHTTAPSNAPTGMPDASPPVLASNAAHPLDQVLEGAVYSVKNGHKELILRLNPDNLGEVRINLISHDNGRLNARLIAQTPESHELLQSQAQTLQFSLEAQGIRVERLSVVLAGQSEGHSRQAASGSDFQASDSPMQNQQNQTGQQGQSGSSDDNAARQAMGDGHGSLFQQHRHGGYDAFTSAFSSEASLEPGSAGVPSEQAIQERSGLTPHEGGQVSILV